MGGACQGNHPRLQALRTPRLVAVTVAAVAWVQGRMILAVSGWVAGPRDSALQGVVCALGSVSEGASAAASLRNAVARVKVSPMVWPASRAWWAWYRAISQDRPRGGSGASVGSGTGFHVQHVMRPSPESGPGSPGSINSARSAS